MKQSEIEAKYRGRRIGFKITDSEMTCRGLKYEMNKLFTIDGEIIPCKNGFHLCNNFTSLFYYKINNKGDKRFFIVEYGKDNKVSNDVIVTNEITFLEEIDPVEYIRDNDGINWYMASAYQKLTEDFIREFQDRVYWPMISLYQELSEDFIREFQDRIDWNHISEAQVLSEDFIREYQDRVDWHHISQAQEISEDFIREFQDKVNWTTISKYQTLSESFIREFKDKVDWSYVFIANDLSYELYCEFKHKVKK